MKKLLKQLVSESAIYGISGMLSRFVSVFLVPLYTKFLLPEEYGKLSLVNSTFYFVSVFAVFAMDSASARWYYDETEDEKRKPVMASWFWFQLGISAFLCVLILLFSGILSKQVLNASSYRLLFIIPAVGLFMNILPVMVTNWLRYQRKAIHTVIFTLCNVLLTLGLNLLFVIKLRMGIQGILISILLANTVASIYVAWLMKDWISYTYFSKEKLKAMLQYAYPLIPTAFAFWILNSSSSFVINHFYGSNEVGLFQIGNMLASVVGMVAGAFQMAWGPFAFSILEKPEAKRVFAAVLTGYSALLCTTALVVALFSKEILVLFTHENYYPAYLTAGLLSFNGIIYGYAYIAVIGCNVVKDNKPLAMAIVCAAALTFVLYFFLVPRFGKEGAAISTSIGYLVVPIYLFYRSQQYWPVPFRFGITIFIFAIALSIFGFGVQIQSNTLDMWVIGKKLLLLLLYFILLFIVIFAGYREEFRTMRFRFLGR